MSKVKTKAPAKAAPKKKTVVPVKNGGGAYGGSLTTGKVKIQSQEPVIDPKPTGTITGLSTQNEKASLALGANLGLLLQRMRIKLTGGEQPIIPMPERAYSPSEIIGALERTEDNTIESLTMLEQLDNLLGEML